MKKSSPVSKVLVCGHPSGGLMRLAMSANMAVMAGPNGREVEVPMGTFTMAEEDGGDTIIIHLDGYMGWWHDKSELRYYLEGRTPKTVIFEITSPGGDPIAAQNMMNYMHQYRQRIGCVIETRMSFAASAATYFALVADPGHRKAYQYTTELYHEPQATIQGTVETVENQLEAFKTTKDLIMQVYEANCTISAQELAELFKKDSPISAEMCLQYGFIDEVIPVTYSQASQMVNNIPALSMASGTEIINTNILTRIHKAMEKKINQLLTMGTFTREDLEGRTEAELDQLLAAAPAEEGFLARMMKKFTAAPAAAPAPAAPETAMAEVQTAMEGVATAIGQISTRLGVIEAQVPQSHTPAAAPAAAPASTMDAAWNLGRNLSTAMISMGSREKPISDPTGTYGFVKAEKPRQEGSMDGLNSLEKHYMILKGKGLVGQSLSMSTLGLTPNAFDVSEIVSELGPHSTQILYDVIYEKKRYDNLAEVFTVEAGLKHRRWEIEGFGSSVSQNFSVKPPVKDDVFSWELSKREVHGCVAAVQIDAYEFARTYFGRLQRNGFDPYNYPAALMIMEMLADCIKADLAEAVVKGVRDDAVTGTPAATNLTMLTGLKKHADDIVTGGINGITAIATGTIYGTGANFHHNIAMQMRNGIDPEYKDDPMAIYCSPDFVEAYQAEQDEKYIYTAEPQNHFDPVTTMTRVRRTNSVLVGLRGLRGSELMVATPKDNARVLFDLEDDMNKVYVQEVGLCQEIYVPYQAGFNLRRISDRFLSINDQS